MKYTLIIGFVLGILGCQKAVEEPVNPPAQDYRSIGILEATRIKEGNRTAKDSITVQLNNFTSIPKKYRIVWGDGSVVSPNFSTERLDFTFSLNNNNTFLVQPALDPAKNYSSNIKFIAYTDNDSIVSPARAILTVITRP